MKTVPAALLTTLLREVSRSFYTTLRVLPSAVRSQIGLAYLLARATDTIADTHLLPVVQRQEALQQLRDAIMEQPGAVGPPDLGELAAAQVATAGEGNSSERALLLRLGDALALIEMQAPPDRLLIRQVLDTITSGQLLDLERFGGASEARIAALRDAAELEDYTYRVAGCVGEFWTRICRAHVYPEAALDERQLLEDGVRFGKGLQLVNILRDLPRDLRQGRCYLPIDELTRAGLAPHDLLDPGKEAAMRPLYEGWIDRAEDHLEAGWRYTNALPFRCVRVRLASAWPALLGVRTLARLRAGPVLDPAQRVKVSRKEVRQMIVRSVLCYPLPPCWRGLYKRMEG